MPDPVPTHVYQHGAKFGSCISCGKHPADPIHGPVADPVPVDPMPGDENNRPATETAMVLTEREWNLLAHICEDWSVGETSKWLIEFDEEAARDLCERIVANAPPARGGVR